MVYFLILKFHLGWFGMVCRETVAVSFGWGAVMDLYEDVFEYFRSCGWKISLIYILGDGVVAVQDGFQGDAGFRLFFNSGAEGRKKLSPFQIWVVDHSEFEEVVSDDPLIWLETAKAVADSAHWLIEPREIPIPLDLVA